MQLTVETESLRPLVKAIVVEVIGDLEKAKATFTQHRLAYTEAEAAALLGMKKYQLRDERLRGRIAGSVGPGRKVFYQRADLEAYLASTRKETTAVR